MNDNYSDIVKQVAQFIIDNAPDGASGQVKELRIALEEGTLKDLVYGVDFRRERLGSVSLYIRHHDGVLTYGYYEDSEGNLWSRGRLYATVSWSAHGALDPKACQEHLAFMAEVVRFAADLESTFAQEVCQLVMTKVQRDAAAKKRAEVLNVDRIKRLAQANVKGMRVGQSRLVEASHGEADFAPAEISFDDPVSPRKYHAVCRAARVFYIERLA